MLQSKYMNKNKPIEIIYDEQYWKQEVLDYIKKEFDTWFEQSIGELYNKYKYKKLDFNNDNNLAVLKEIEARLDAKYFIKKVLSDKLHYYGNYAINNDFALKINLDEKLKFANDNNQNSVASSWSFFNNNILINKTTYFNPFNDLFSLFVENNLIERDTNIDKVINFIPRLKQSNEETQYNVLNNMNKNYQINSLFCYTETAKGLEFSFENDIKRNDYRFENSKFNKNYKWIISDNSLIRTVFTPYFMESFLKLNNNKKIVLDKYQINKKDCWFYSNYNPTYNSFSFAIKGIRISELFKKEFKFYKYKKKLFKVILDVIKDKYDSISCLTIVPLIYTEDHSYLIQDILNKPISSFNNIYDYTESNFVIYEVLRFIKNSSFITYMNFPKKEITENFVACNIKFSLWDKESMIKGKEWIIPYNLYYLKLNLFNIYYIQDKDKDFFTSNLHDNKNLIKLINKFIVKNEISHFAIDDGYLAFLSKKDFGNISKEELVEIIQQTKEATYE